MVNVQDLIQDPDFAQPFTIYRKTGAWQDGAYTQSEQQLTAYGIIIAANAKDLLQVPEGDRVKGIMVFYSTEPLLVTNSAGTSDQVVWRGERYRLFPTWPYVDYGYYKALGERMAGD